MLMVKRRAEKRRERQGEEEGSLFQKSMVNFPSRNAPDLVVLLSACDFGRRLEEGRKNLICDIK